MNSGWGAMVATESETLRTDHGLAEARFETALVARVGNRYATESLRQGARAGWWAAVEYVLRTQGEWESLTEADAIAELRKGAGSLYHPLFVHDPRVWVDCPRDGRVTVDQTGICDRCLYDFSE